MKILKVAFALLGVVVLAVAGYYLFNAWVDIRSMMAIANANRSAEFVSPWGKVLTCALLAAGGALALGLALGLPLHTPGGIRRKALQDAADARELQIRDRAAAARHRDGETDDAR